MIEIAIGICGLLIIIGGMVYGIGKIHGTVSTNFTTLNKAMVEIGTELKNIRLSHVSMDKDISKVSGDIEEIHKHGCDRREDCSFIKRTGGRME